MQKKNIMLKQRKRVLQEKMEHVQKQLQDLKRKQQLAIGALVCKHNFDHVILDKAFAQLFKELNNGTQNEYVF